MANSNFLLELLSGALGSAGESKLLEVLQQLHDNDKTTEKTDYKSAIIGGYSFCVGISKLVTASKTKIDDSILTALQEAITESAKANGVKLQF